MVTSTLVPTELGPAIPIVQAGYEHWSGIALAAFQKAEGLVSGLGDTGFTPINLNIPFDLSDSLGAYKTGNPPEPFDLSQADIGAVDAPPDLPAFDPGALLNSLQPPTENFSFTPGTYNDDMIAAVGAS